VLVAAIGLIGVGAAAAEMPQYTGSVPLIRNAGDPEEYPGRLNLGDGQHLEQIDEDTVGVVYEDGTVSFTIPAEPARDANGATVPTTLAVTQPDVITLTVHHRQGNPAAGGAPFTYPITGGVGWEGGFGSVQVEVTGPKPPAATGAPSGAPSGAPATKPSEAPHVLVTRALGDPKLYYRPHSFLLSADGTFGLGRVRWTAYGGSTATATARASVDDCVPNCAAGRVHHPPARLTLSRVVDCDGTEIYARLRYELTGSLPEGFPRRRGYSMRPLGADGKPAC
jgi:hypothetical protein